MTKLESLTAAEEVLSSVSGRRRARDADATRDQILAAAMIEFAEKGLHGARVEEIAGRTATSKHMIYYYFNSKDRLYAAVLERAYADFRSAELALDYDTLAPLDALAALVGNAFDSHLRNPHIIRIIMSENLDLGRHIVEMPEIGQADLVLDTKRRILERGIRAGVFRPDLDPLQLHMTISALCFHFVANRFTFSRIFGNDMAAEPGISERRAEVVETVLARCRA